MLHMNCGLGYKHQKGVRDFVQYMYTEEFGVAMCHVPWSGQAAHCG